ncbi:sigma factor-like helix-turn-helix DNA-binding protein [Desulfosarcina sp.]|uniref:sigma factor-like helix-turn-helix DNA-binding protein n=1 Tax=Desulfosarcina sp. TaxID=2027861 RepID=UPI0039B96428
MREAEVLKRRFGIGKRTACALQQVANDFGRSLERIRQIQAESIAKMRKYALNRRSDFIDG